MVVGLNLPILGIEASNSRASDFSRLLAGNPTDRSVCRTMGGVIAIAVGTGTAATSWKMLTKA